VSAFKDGLLYAAVKARLAGTDIDSTTRISVIVHDGVVTLRGRVKDGATREREVKLVRAMRGIADVNDELLLGHVGPSAAQTVGAAARTVGDAALIAAVESALAEQTGINVAGIAVHADAGTVTLGGHAPTAAIRSTAVAAARKTPGVRNVVDRIAVK
jgi:osmotically-inducible protein OsmY